MDESDSRSKPFEQETTRSGTGLCPSASFTRRADSRKKRHGTTKMRAVEPSASGTRSEPTWIPSRRQKSSILPGSVLSVERRLASPGSNSHNRTSIPFSERRLLRTHPQEPAPKTQTLSLSFIGLSQFQRESSIERALHPHLASPKMVEGLPSPLPFWEGLGQGSFGPR